MSFERMSSSLPEVARQRIHNGDFSERSLARFLGISQPHAHNVLKGVRHITPELFDTMLKRLGLDVLDLYPRAEISHYLARRKLP
jgi:plasmid maintenance system antidote protein VapI